MSDAVQQIKDRLNIIDVISPYVELHKAGKNFKGKSPFSAEKTPSFYVSPDRGMYYCFSTSQGGDHFTFIQTMEGVDFKEALKILADKAGVELVPEDPKKKTERERWLAALDAATVFYQAELQRCKPAQAYLASRKVKPETIAAWRIGYAPGPPTGGWRAVKEQLEAQSFTKTELLQAGLIKAADGGKEPYDVFRDRIMFPMSDPGGHVVAFSGRLLTPNEKAPKYVNSPETELYKKSELLFGYDKAKHGIRTLDFSLIVEGQFDVVMSHQAGYTNAVAVSGTALTVHHVQLLARLSERVVLALDADRAGVAAMKRAAELMLQRGLDVKVAEVPDGKDPADLVREGNDALKAVVGKAVHVIEFLLHLLKRNETDKRTLKLKAREEVLPYILLLPNHIDQEHFTEVVAREIGSTTDAIRYELERLREELPRRETQRTNQEQTDITNTPTSFDTVERLRIYLTAAEKLLPPEYQAVIGAEVQKLLHLKSLPALADNKITEAVFLLEQHFEKISTSMMLEEVVEQVNQLRDAIAKQAIRELRQEMSALESDEQLQYLERISEWETVRKGAPLTTADIEQAKV
jgi:DNA primase